MKVLAIVTGRNGGVGEFLAKTALKGAQDAGAEIELINLRNLKLNYCTECNRCQDPPAAWVGRCIIKDDFPWLDDKLLDSDAVVVVAPAYEKSIPAELKTLMDRTGPNHDITIRKNFAQMRAERGIDDGRSIDERSFKKRPAVFITHGGTDWASLSLATMKLWAIPMGFDMVDAVYIPWNILVRQEDDRLKRIYDSGAHAAKCAANAVAEYIGDTGVCPVCASRVVTILPDGQIECAVCGVRGKPVLRDGVLTAEFAPEALSHSLYTDSGRMGHLRDMLGNGMKLRTQDMSVSEQRNKEMLEWLKPSRPPRD